MKFPHGVDLEFCRMDSQSRKAGWSDGKPSLQEESAQEGLCIRTLQEGGEGVLMTRDLDKNRISEKIDKSLSYAQHTPKDPYRMLVQKGAVYPGPIEKDDQIFSQTIPTLLDRLEAVEKLILKADARIKKVVKCEVELQKVHTTLSNSNGVEMEKEATSASALMEVLAEKNSQSEVVWDMMETRFASDLSLESMAMEVAQEAVRALGGRSMPSGRYSVIIHPRVSVQFLDLLSNALSAEDVYLGRSFLQGKCGESIASPHIAIFDDALLKKGVASEHFDDEGNPHQALEVVSKGKLKSFLYDQRSAAREKRKSTGHGMKGGLSQPPKPSPTNFYIERGPNSFEKMISSYPKIFLIKDIMGLHMANPMTGEFSLGASGGLYEGGKWSQPVRGVTIAGQLSDFFKKVTAVGDDLRWYGSFGSPSLLISDLMVAGQ